MSMRWKHDYIIKQIDVLKLLRSDGDYLLAFPHQRALGAVLAADNVVLALGRNVAINPGAPFTFTIGVLDDWSIVSTPADPDVTEVGTGEGHGGVGTGFVNLFSSATAFRPIISQSLLSTGTWYITIIVDTVTSGSIIVQDSGSQNSETINAPGTYNYNWTITGNVDIQILGSGTAPTDVTLTSVTVQQTGILDSGDYPGAELLPAAGGDPMHISNWTAGFGATLTNPSPEILRVTHGGATANPTATQAILTIGEREGVVLETRSDGNATPRFFVGAYAAGNNFDGTTSTDWQPFDIEHVTTVSAIFALTAQTAVSGQYTEWRSMSVTPANPLNGDDTGTEPGVPMGSYYSKTDDGATSFSALGLTEYNSMINLELFHIGIGIQKAVWDTTERYFISHIIDADNWIKIGGTTTAGQLVYEIRAGGVTEQVLYASGSPTVIIMPSISSKGGVMKAWLGRTQVGGDVSIANTLAGNFASMTIGAENGTPLKVNLANRNWYWHMSDEKTTAELERIAKGIGAAL